MLFLGGSSTRASAKEEGRDRTGGGATDRFLISSLILVLILIVILIPTDGKHESTRLAVGINAVIHKPVELIRGNVRAATCDVRRAMQVHRGMGCD